MKTNAVCHDVACDPSVGERPRYYARQLVTADDMTLEQEYFRSKLRLHNRLLHGWGVVCGLEVCPVPAANKETSGGYEPWKVIVKQGYALDCCGNEINLDCCRIIDLRTEGVTGATGDPCVEAQDPWCSETFVNRKETCSLYVAVKYKAMMTRPVRVQPVGCGCDDNACEYSRWRDGYEISILTYCPDSHSNPPEESMEGCIPKCPECPDNAWVGLATVQVDKYGKILTINNCECRRLVKSFGHFWWKCTAKVPDISNVEADALYPGTQGAPVKIIGSNFKEGLQVDFGQGITVKDVEVGSGEITLKIDVTKNAALGPRPVTVVNPDCSTATHHCAITINETYAHPAPQETYPQGESQRRRVRRRRQASQPE